MKAGAAWGLPRRSVPVSWSRLSMSSTLQSSACAALRSQCPTPGISSRQRCRKSTPLLQPSREWYTPMAEFCMPSLGTDMEAGTLVEWLVQPGAQVKRGDIIAVVETEKGIIDIEVFEAGVVEQLLVQPGTKVP